MSGKQDLSFEEMLEVFHHYYPDHVVNLIDAIVSIRHLPTMYAQFKHALGIKDYLKAHPYALAVLKCLRLEEYQQNKRHLDGLISKLVGITFDLEKEALRSLVHHGIIEFREERYVIRNKSFTYVMRYQKSKNFRKYYQHRLLEFFDLHENLPAGCFMFHDVWAIPKENMREVIDLCFDFCIKVRKLTENNQTSAKYIRGVNLSLFTLDK
jgi:serine/threonine protein kinase